MGRGDGEPGHGLRRSEEDDFVAFVEARRPALVRYAGMLTGSTGAGEDLVQTALVRCLPRWGRVDPAGAESYVRTVVARLAWQASRDAVDRPISYDAAYPAGSGDVAAPVAEPDRDAALDLRAALDELPGRQRVVLVLRYWVGLTEAATADQLGCSVGTVKSRSSRALAQLRRRLDPPLPLASPAKDSS